MTSIPATLRIRSEGALRSRAARGDTAAFAAVYERHHQALYRYCRSILRHDEDAQDALQSTMARAFAALQDEQRDFELRPWLFRIAHNEAITILRRRRETDELDEQPAPGELEDRVSEREELRLLQLDLADLPERQRAALILRELNGLCHPEIGVVLELSTGAVKQAIFDARSALFSFREGREMACQDVRRMLSDGDGRVLRGRGVRGAPALLPGLPPVPGRPRTAPEGAARARAAAADRRRRGAARPAARRRRATAAKLLACVAIAGGGTTLAVEMQHAREPAPEAARHRTADAARARRRRTPPRAASAPATPSRPRRAAPQPKAKPHQGQGTRPRPRQAAKAKAQARRPPARRGEGAQAKTISGRHAVPRGEGARPDEGAGARRRSARPRHPARSSAKARQGQGAEGQADYARPDQEAPTEVASRKAEAPSPRRRPAQAKQDAPKTTGPPAETGKPEKSGKDKADK